MGRNLSSASEGDDKRSSRAGADFFLESAEGIGAASSKYYGGSGDEGTVGRAVVMVFW